MLTSPEKERLAFAEHNETKARLYKPAGRKTDHKEEDKKQVAKKRELENSEGSPKRFKRYDGLDDLLLFARHKSLCKGSYRIMITGSSGLGEYKKVLLG